jgi:hypothetical protein
VDLVTWRARLGITSNAPEVERPTLTAAIVRAAIEPPAPESRLTSEAQMTMGLKMLEAEIVNFARSGLEIADVGLQAACGPLESFFSAGLENASSPHRGQKSVPGDLLKEVLGAVLADRFSNFRFRRGADEPQLACLSLAQRTEWMQPREYLSLRFQGDSFAKFEERAKTAAALAAEALIPVSATLGTLDAARERHASVVEELRSIPKNERERRIAAGEEASRCAKDVQILEHLTQLATERMDPERLKQLGASLKKFEDVLGAERTAAFAEATKIDDLQYTSGRTYEDPPAATRFKLSAIGCMSWPDGTALSECCDANKHLLCTDSEKYGIVQGTLRIVEATDGSGPALLLERLYPDLALEEKARLIDHALMRAEAMRVPLLLPEEYFWSCDKWTRTAPTGSVKIPAMNEVIAELAQLHGATMSPEPKEVQVKAVIGQVGAEYIDSAPIGGAKYKGHAQARRYGPQDATFDNAFTVLLPRGVEKSSEPKPGYEFEPLFPSAAA